MIAERFVGGWFCFDQQNGGGIPVSRERECVLNNMLSTDSVTGLRVKIGIVTRDDDGPQGVRKRQTR
jgi:hypothetical protein